MRGSPLFCLIDQLGWVSVAGGVYIYSMASRIRGTKDNSVDQMIVGSLKPFNKGGVDI